MAGTNGQDVRPVEPTIAFDDFGELRIPEKPKQNRLQRILPQLSEGKMGHPCYDPRWQEVGAAAKRRYIMEQIENLKDQRTYCITAGYPYLDLGNGQKVPLEEYQRWQHRAAYDALKRGVNPIVIAMGTNQTTEDVLKIAEEFNIAT